MALPGDGLLGATILGGTQRRGHEPRARNDEAERQYTRA